MPLQSSVPLLFGLVAPLTFWACESCEIISYVDSDERGGTVVVPGAPLSQGARGPATAHGGAYEDISAEAAPEPVVVTIAPNLAVTAQPQLSDLSGFADAGYRTLMSNRPAREAPNQPTPAALATEAERQGMAFIHIPVTVESISRADVAAFRTAVAEAREPVIAHCRSGKRAYLLWAAGEALEEGRNAETLMRRAAEHGFALDELPALLERLQQQAP